MKMNDFSLEHYLLLFRVLGNEDRITMLKKMIKSHLPAQDVQKLFYMEQSTASYHLNMMKRAGILTTKKEGKKSIYSYVPGSLERLLNGFLPFLNMDTESTEVG